ncbi:MAG TPA: hypothetical protein V6C97_20015, partial [Oculatellaceae cyanobacterium]
FSPITASRDYASQPEYFYYWWAAMGNFPWGLSCFGLSPNLCWNLLKAPSSMRLPWLLAPELKK